MKKSDDQIKNHPRKEMDKLQHINLYLRKRVRFMKTAISITARSSGQTGYSRPYHQKKKSISIDRDRLQQLSDQLTDLVEELDDIREDLGEMYSEIEEGISEEDENTCEGELLDRMEEICETISSAYEGLNEALDEMAEI